MSTIDDAAAPFSWDPAQMLARVWAGRYRVLLCMLVCTGAAMAYVAVSPTVWRATTVLVPAGAERGGLGGLLGSTLGGSLGGLASMAGVNLGGASSQTEEALAVLRSRQFNEDFIRERGLLPELFAKEWDPAAKQWIGGPGNEPEMSEAVRRFLMLRKVAQDRKTNLVTVQIDWTDPRKAADWTNALVARLNAEMRNRAAEKAGASLQFLQRELEGTTEVGTRQAINQLIAAQINQRMLANVTQEYAFRVVDAAKLPGRRDIVGPRRAMITAAGLAFGGFLGVLVALLFPPRRRG